MHLANLVSFFVFGFPSFLVAVVPLIDTCFTTCPLRLGHDGEPPRRPDKTSQQRRHLRQTHGRRAYDRLDRVLDHGEPAHPITADARRREVLQEGGHEQGVGVDRDVPEDPEVEPLRDDEVDA